MATLSLETLKAHVRADDFADDDRLLAVYLDSAEDYVVRATHRSLDELLQMGGGGSLPPALQQAVLLLAGHWYNQREAVDAPRAEVPLGVSTLIKTFRKLA